MTTSPRLGFTELTAGQAVPETTANEMLRYAEQGAGHFIITDRDLSAPPGSPVDGKCYIVAGTGTGAWATHDGDIAFYMNTAWEFINIVEGFTFWIADEDLLLVATSSSTFSTVASGSGITALTGDVTASGPGSVAATVANANYSATLTATGTPVATSLGYLGAPQNIGLDSGNVTLALADSGKHVYHTDANARDLTIPANSSVAFPVGTVVAGVNENGAGVITLKITTDTLRWGVSTGQRAIAANATFTLLKVAATVWRLTGDGIT